jgi:hypothetical protein
MKNTENAHRSYAHVLDAMHHPWRKMNTRTRAELNVSLSLAVKNCVATQDVGDLVVLVVVIARAAVWNRTYELRHSMATDGRSDDETKLAIFAGG